MNLKESKLTYLALGLVAGLALAWVYAKWIKKSNE
jgi:hypothetical protein